MKKTLVTAITTALVVGAASTTFAAANPFSDVPRDNWAYDAVTKLAQDGVVNGYGDGSFRGDATITRYEMAQIVAKAMAKTDVSAADKATIDKLAAEYADELNNLGVRVDNLEKKVDNVKFTGEARYRYTSQRLEGVDRTNADKFLFRLEPTAQINNNWAAKARLDWTSNLDTDSNADGNNATVDRVYVQGKLFDGAATVKLGKLPVYSSQGILIDDRISGAQIAFGSKTFTTTVSAGRYSTDAAAAIAQNITGNVGILQFDYQPTSKLGLIAGYTVFNSKDLNNAYAYQSKTNLPDANKVAYGADSLNIWNVGATYAFDKNVKLSTLYSKNTKGDFTIGDLNKAYNVQLNYKGAVASKTGSWGVWAAYRCLGSAAVLSPTDDSTDAGQKGYELGATYTFDKNIVGTAKYFKGHDILTDLDASKIFGQVEFFF
jgi:hypothetical protein